MTRIAFNFCVILSFVESFLIESYHNCYFYIPLNTISHNQLLVYFNKSDTFQTSFYFSSSLKKTLMNYISHFKNSVTSYGYCILALLPIFTHYRRFNVKVLQLETVYRLKFSEFPPFWYLVPRKVYKKLCLNRQYKQITLMDNISNCI